MIGMATKKSTLLKRLALAREAKAEKSKPKVAPPSEPEKSPDLGIIANPSRELAAEVTEMAMVAGWDKAIQEHAYQNRVSEDRVREILDEALDYDDKADPSGRIEGIEDWAREKRGNSTLKARAMLS
jgi:hypothetical protein